jgi:hypothetical protein
MNMRFVFAMHDRWAVDSFTHEFALETGWNSDDFKQFYKETTKEKHAFILLVTEDGDTKIYRRIPNGRGLELVRLQEPVDVTRDQKLADLVERYRLAEQNGSGRDRARCRQNLMRYKSFLAETSSLDEDDIAEQIYETFGVDI